ncbi:DUF3108 domain-containing protein [Neisseria sp. ZJ106]|uniref:DUF3108 domain-containing protein n=1 Tax=Neisseria lisongii TaxID=2912188 RepID=A0AAW5AI74_9NEIS|nr:DUF3108 domain-containing protein [Neisseria lisongii]MCF7520827.1 DUF3108 domain-containing protein [Neisseria lisongii]MCF7529316.1 DUF3108 domain-containing protein [Neisseria lisongii]WCL70762.1 DUF3108 domain-containing protein [Neisseria lisongii]
MKPILLPLLLAALPLASYAAELPQSAELRYSGSYGIPATMTFTRSGNNYRIVSDIKVPLYKIRFESGGVIAGNTLKPAYYKDIRGGKVYAQARFSGNSITYGKTGDSHTETLSGNSMDLFTLAWQLAANDAKLPANLSITNGKKIYRAGNISQIGNAAYRFNGGTTNVNRYRIRQGDNTVNYAFAPAFHNIPTQITYSDDGKSYDLKLVSAKINGQTVQP